MITRERMGEIALTALKRQMAEEGAHLLFSRGNLTRRLGNKSKELGATREELFEMAEIMVRELVEETFGKK